MPGFLGFWMLRCQNNWKLNWSLISNFSPKSVMCGSLLLNWEFRKLTNPYIKQTQIHWLLKVSFISLLSFFRYLCIFRANLSSSKFNQTCSASWEIRPEFLSTGILCDVSFRHRACLSARTFNRSVSINSHNVRHMKHTKVHHSGEDNVQSRVH